MVSINVDVKQKYLDQAEMLRKLYDSKGIKVFELLGSPGSGKTALAEAVIDRIKDKYKILYFGGDVASTLDAERVAKHGIEAVEINTGGICHLEPSHVMEALKNVDLSKYDIMFIENVGNLICPINFPLGAHKRILVVSVAEGEDKFVKHPMSTKAADVIVISKVDLADAIGVDVKKMEEDARKLNPKAPIIKVSVKTGEGIDELVKALGL
ncbi:hydrogenase nickel incorporation protein HypB [Ignicoccus pacificus DSM 13166]|uniref:Hydrogenase nickel incorporation protein HypB n=1 Tax=Ignicoccus pacificus DSM 13166 TaxID=940294 RepID=A0A977PKX3_9CREN|nr:hydrogenase nickel incorporation protein HypB [Ignicoccus pacificus DSM 13166]